MAEYEDESVRKAKGIRGSCVDEDKVVGYWYAGPVRIARFDPSDVIGRGNSGADRKLINSLPPTVPRLYGAGQVPSPDGTQGRHSIDSSLYRWYLVRWIPIAPLCPCESKICPPAGVPAVNTGNRITRLMSVS